MAAGEPPDRPGTPQRRGWWVAAVLLALLLVFGVGLVVLWVQAPALYGKGDAAKTAAATTRGAILTVAAALIAATAAGAGVYITARTIRINQQVLAETQQANAETQRANREADQRDRYAKAIDQLGSSKLDVRLGGIYGLERIAKTSEQDHPTVVEVLGAYVRQHTDPIRRRRQLPPAAVQGKAPSRPAVDVQAAITVLGRLPSRDGVSQGDLSGAQLTGARLVGTNLSKAWLDRADLTHARLDGANLASADLTDARLHGANLATVKNLTQQQLDSASGDGQTELPGGRQRPAHWSAGPATHRQPTSESRQGGQWGRTDGTDARWLVRHAEG